MNIDDKDMTHSHRSEVLTRASRGLPFVGLSGLIFCGGGAFVVEAWWPVIWYLIPWIVYTIIYYINKIKFIYSATWCMKIKILLQFFIFVYSPSLTVYAVLIDWYGIYYGMITSLIYTALIYVYFKIYLERTHSAWEEKRTSNYRFALDPINKTFRYRQGFNFGPIPGMWWDNLVFGALLGLTTFSGALIGGLAVDIGAGKPLFLTASVLWLLIWTRGSIVREVVSLQKIQAYEQEHGVTIRPR